MNRLQSELQRLYLPRGQDCGPESGLIAPDGRTGALVLEIARPAGWAPLARVWQGVQAELGLPEPAIAINGVDGYQLWFSLAEPVALAQARDWLEALRARYLGDVAPARLRLLPASASTQARLVPALQAAGRWSAFVAADLAPMFAEDPWLDLPPNPDGQADLLARLRGAKPAEFQHSLERLLPAAAEGHAATSAGSAGVEADPLRFLLGVMQDDAAPLPLRVEAAKALLPYCAGSGRR